MPTPAVQLTLRLTLDEHARLVELSREMQISAHAAIKLAIQELLAKHREPAPAEIPGR